jgi:hypothetical protein
MTAEDFRRYLEAFNRSDFESFGEYLSPNIHFEGQAGEFHSRAQVLSFYAQVKARLEEKIEILGLVIGERDVVAELRTELRAKEDWADFPTGPLHKGETRRSQNFVWYETHHGMFESIRSARYRSLADHTAADPPVRETSALSMSAQRFASYIDAFNRNDVATYADYYDDDVVLVLAGKTELRGRQAILDFYKVVKSQTQRTLRIKKFVAANNRLAVELESEFLALQDLPEFTAGPMYKGGRIYINTFVLYDLQDGKFARIRSAQFRKIIRA